MEYKLTLDQENALNGILDFIFKPVKERDDVACTLSAYAGCGKTFLTRIIVNKVSHVFSIIGVAPTHKARKVLEDFLNNASLLKIKTSTIASLLSKIKQHNYIGTQNYSGSSNEKMQKYDLFIIDEASMITDSDINCIINYAFQLNRKIIFVGDKYQIPNPTQKYICKNGFATKKESEAFFLKHQFQLVTNMRQKDNNPLVDVYTELLLSIKECREPTINRKDNSIGEYGIKYYKDKETWMTTFCNLYNSMEIKHNIRILAYTNERIKYYNQNIRKKLKILEPFKLGEILMGYNNIGWPNHIIENGQDYYIVQIEHTIKHKIYPYSDLVGHIIKIQPIQDKNCVNSIFIPDISCPKNQDILNELIKLAEKVNQIKSNKNTFKEYSKLKNQLVFMENIYKFNNKITGEEEFKYSHPLLFKSVIDIIKDQGEGDRSIIENDLSQKINLTYKGLIEDRIQDDKPLTPVERLCDKYCVIQKDIDYGYCITAHKSQGSTFHTVFIDETDFEKLKNYWSYDLDCYINTIKEKGQLKYVCYTRPTHTAHVFFE
jgi:hypothetical protein